jgi:hypothetical protein
MMGEEQPRFHSSRIVIATATGAAVGCCCLALAYVTAFGICSDSTLAELLFPYAVAYDPTLYEKIFVAFLMAVAQYPIYGMIAGFAWSKAPSHRALLVICLLVVFASHLLAFEQAHARVEAFHSLLGRR